MMTLEEPTLTRRERREREAAQRTVEPVPVVPTPEPAATPARKKPNLKVPSASVPALGKDTGSRPVLSLDDDDEYKPSRPAYVEASELTSAQLAELLAEQEREAQVIQEALDREAERKRLSQQEAEREEKQQRAPVATDRVDRRWKIFVIGSFAMSCVSALCFGLSALGVI